MVFKMKNFLKDESIDRKEGKYSVNKTAGAFIIFVLLFSVFCAQPLKIKLSGIKNTYFKNLAFYLIKPVEDLSHNLKIYNLFPYTRNCILTFTKLNKKLEWEDFYYTENTDSNNIETPIKQPLQKKAPPYLYLKKCEALQIAELEKIKYGFSSSETSSESSLEQQNKAAGKIETKKEIPDLEIKAEKENQTEENFSANSAENSLTQTKELTRAEAEEENSEMQENIQDKKIEKEDITSAVVYDYTVEKPFRILMFGDSQMRSLAGGLQKLISEQKAIQITEISVHSSGFVRGDYYNWNKKLENVFNEAKNAPYDATIFLLGMNDYQNFYSNEGKVLVKESSAWEEKYKEKVNEILKLVLANSKKVYWLGLPVVRRKTFNEDLSYIENVQIKTAAEYNNKNLIKISLREIAPGKGSPYIDNIQIEDGKYIKLMRDDGIHYTISGGEYIMKSFLETLYKDWKIEK